jgi:hypothetical protein
MCLIVDANVAALVFVPQPHADFRPIWDALERQRAVAVHGGHLTREYLRLGQIRRLLQELDRRGSLRKIPDAAVEASTAEFARRGIHSDDPHILGLAEVSHVRLLCSHDQNLHADFTNPDLLRPAGSVYQNASHRRLIARHCTPRGPTRRRRSKKKRRS